MSRSKRNNRRSDTKNYEAWVSLNHFKEQTGLSIKDIHLILAQQGLWSNRRPTTNAIESRIARYNQTLSRYEWRNSVVTRLVTTYIREGTAEARKQAREQTRNQPVQEKQANTTPPHSTAPLVKNFGTKDQPSTNPYWIPLSKIQEKTKFSLDEVNFILTAIGAMESGIPSQKILDKKSARQNPDTLKYEWHRNRTLNLINAYVQKADKRWRKEAQQAKRQQASAFKRTTVQTPRPTIQNPALEQEILRIFKEVEETQRKIAGYKIVDLSSHSNPYSPLQQQARTA